MPVLVADLLARVDKEEQGMWTIKDVIFAGKDEEVTDPKVIEIIKNHAKLALLDKADAQI